ncbi:GL17229 [Drosophila persimilis]|uniref:GL17229 n=1 Tax=Drosophila persimilis TaxID=7234 RepID=B4GIU3_DROPE|nr:GL17229 [Drosophila persimilis]
MSVWTTSNAGGLETLPESQQLPKHPAQGAQTSKTSASTFLQSQRQSGGPLNLNSATFTTANTAHHFQHVVAAAVAAATSVATGHHQHQQQQHHYHHNSGGASSNHGSSPTSSNGFKRSSLSNSLLQFPPPPPPSGQSHPKSRLVQILLVSINSCVCANVSCLVSRLKFLCQFSFNSITSRF